MKPLLTTTLIILFSLLAFSQDTIMVGYGPEDMDVDYSTGKARLIVPCTARRKTELRFSEVVSIDLTTHKVDTLTRLNEPKGFDFRPHGLDIITNSKGETKVFFTNHSHYWEVILHSVVKYRLEGNTLYFEAIYTDDTKKYIRSPNDVAALANESFYVTNDSWKKTTTGLLFEKLFKRRTSKITYYSEATGWKIAAKRLAYANGIQADENRVMVACIFKKDFVIYNRQPDGSLTKHKRIKAPTGMDNITLVNDSVALVASHTNLMAFLKHIKNPEKLSPFRLDVINLNTGEVTKIFENDGSLISAVSTAIYANGQVYIGQVFNPFIVVAPIKLENY